MSLCKKCGKREQYTSPKGRTVALCSVCGWDAIVELVGLPELGGLTQRAVDLPMCSVCGESIVFKKGLCEECFLLSSASH